MRVLFLTHLLPPELGTPHARVLEMARGLGARGHRVTVLTGSAGQPSGVGPAGRGRRILREQLDGVPVVRSWAQVVPGRGAGRWALGHLCVAAGALAAARALPARPDVISVDLHPVVLGLAADLLSRAWRVPFVVSAGELVPEPEVATGALTNPVAISAARSARDHVCRRAAMITPSGRGLADALLQLGVGPERLEVIHNGADTGLFDGAGPELPLPPEVRRRLEGRFVVLCAGPHGPGQGLDVALEAAARLAGDPTCLFALAGDGPEKPRLVSRARELGLANVAFLDPVPHASVPALYRLASACLVSLRRLPVRIRPGVPSELFEAMAASRPVLLCADGEPEEILRTAGAGVAVPPGDGRRLADAVRELRRDPGGMAGMAARGRAHVVGRASLEQQTARYEQVLFRALGRRQGARAAGGTGG